MNQTHQFVFVISLSIERKNHFFLQHLLNLNGKE
jgi:hypothetical protein